MPALFRQTKPHALPPNAEIVDKDGKPHARIRDGKQTKLFPLTVDGKRYLRPSLMWCAMVKGTDGRRKPVRLSTDKDAAAVLLAKLVKDIEHRKAGIRTGDTDAAAKPLADHLAEWERHLKANGRTDEYIRWKLARVRRVFDGCGFVFARDLDAAAVENTLHALRTNGGSIQTANDYLQAVKQFARWMLDNDRLPKNPFSRLKPGNTATDVRHRRGELTADELAKLLATTANSATTFRGLTGRDREALYRAALNPIHDRTWSFGGTDDRVETTRTFPSEDHG